MSWLFRTFIAINVIGSRWLDRVVPDKFCVDGNNEFRKDFVWRYMKPGLRIYDIGGGKQPFLSVERKCALACTVVGIDISEDELSRAPAGAYDQTIKADIGTFQGGQDGDVVICQALLEHVPDAEAAMISIASVLKPGGVLLLFVPCRNAPFARLNLLLPESLKRRVLFAIFPSTRHAQGFPSYYDRCTPSQLSKIAETAGYEVLELRRYYMSSYFSFFFPLYFVWRFWTLLEVAFRVPDACETVSMALRKHEG